MEIWCRKSILGGSSKPRIFHIHEKINFALFPHVFFRGQKPHVIFLHDFYVRRIFIGFSRNCAEFRRVLSLHMTAHCNATSPVRFSLFSTKAHIFSYTLTLFLWPLIEQIAASLRLDCAYGPLSASLLHASYQIRPSEIQKTTLPIALCTMNRKSRSGAST